jgi:hypothetical protein
MQTAQQHARGSGARLALSLLTASRATPSRHAPGAVAEQEVLLDPLQRLAGIGELVAALRSLRFCSASSAFSCFFWRPPGHLAAPPRPPASPAPEQGGWFAWPFVCSGAAHASQPRPAGPRPPRAALAPPPPRWDAARCVRLRRFARGCFPYRGLWAVSHVLVHPAPPRKGSQRSRRHRLRLTSAARFKGAGRHSPPPTRPRTASGRPRAILDQRTKFPSTF